MCRAEFMIGWSRQNFIVKRATALNILETGTRSY
jgi:hypothetical protein